MGRKLRDLIGMKFNRLLVISLKEMYPKVKWICKCDCGKVSFAESGHLLSGGTKSCGCWSLDRKKTGTHGYATKGRIASEYRIWSGLKQRCNNKKDISYPNYGGRGIKVCKRWSSSFENFLNDMGKRPSKKHSIERRKNNIDYKPSNCYWGTQVEQSRNKRSNIWYEVNGEKKIINDWRIELKTSCASINYHLSKGRSFEYIYHHFKSKQINPQQQ